MATTDSSENRQAKRMPVTLKIKFKSETLNQFIERYSVDVSHGGIFIRTKDPLAVGTTLRFEFQLKDATPLIKGEGTVVWTREHDPARAGVAPGMGVRFDRLPSESQQVLEEILEQKSASEDDAFEDDDDDDDDDGGFKESPTRVAPAQLVDKLTADDYSTGSDRTPLPRPMPFHSDAEDFPEETFEEATRVASLDQLVASTKGKGDEAKAGSDNVTDSDDERAETEAENRDEAGDAAAAAEGDSDAAAEDDASADDDAASADTEGEASPADGDELDDVETTVAARALDDVETTVAPKRGEADEAEDPGQRRAEVATPVAREDEGGGSNMPWIAAAAAILLIAGAGGFWFMSKSRDQARAESAPAEAETETAEAEMAAAPAPEPVEPAEPEVATVDVEIQSEPAGATAVLVGSDQRGTTPATFAVEEGKSYQVEVSHPGHVAQVIEVEAGAEPPVVELEPMKKMVRVTSSPPGAIAYVQGRRQRGTTPVDVELSGRLAKADSLKIKLRKPGFQVWTESVAIGESFSEEDGVLVHTVSAELAKRQVARRPPPPPSGGSTSADTEKVETSGADQAPQADEGADEAAAKDEQPKASEPKASEPKASEPKASEPKAGEPKASEPAPAGDTKTAEPTPDWMQ